MNEMCIKLKVKINISLEGIFIFSKLTAMREMLIGETRARNIKSIEKALIKILDDKIMPSLYMLKI